MAICTQCGLIMNDADIPKHVCAPSDLPSKGMAKKPTTTDKPVEI